jgi:hypothetical protein
MVGLYERNGGLGLKREGRDIVVVTAFNLDGRWDFFGG